MYIHRTSQLIAAEFTFFSSAHSWQQMICETKKQASINLKGLTQYKVCSPATMEWNLKSKEGNMKCHNVEIKHIQNL